jgi:MFS family permease
VMMLIFALAGPRAAARRSPKRVSQVGLLALSIGAVVLLATIDVELNETGFAIGLAIFGAGVGLLASQLGNVIMSSVDQSRSNETGGLQGTAQNLGASLGTALIGAVLLSGLTSGFVERIEQNPALPADLRTSIATEATTSGLQVVPVDEVEAFALAAGLPPEQATAIATDYGDAQLDGLRNALGAVAFLAVLGFPFTRRLPGEAASDAEPSAA